MPRRSAPNSGTQWAWFGRGYAGDANHTQTLSQSVAMPAFKDGALSFHVWANHFERPLSALTVKFDQQVLLQINEANAVLDLFAYDKPLTLPIGDRVDPGLHTLSFEYNSPAGPSFAGSGGEAALRFECELDLGRFGSCGSPKLYTGLRPGPHAFEVRAVDAAGNVDPTPARHEFKAGQGSSGRAR